MNDLMRLLKASLLVALAATLITCGSSDNSNDYNSSGTGSIIMRAVWPGSAGIRASANDIGINAAPPGVVTMRVTVSGADMFDVQQDFPAAAGSGTVRDVPAGTNRTATLQGLDAGSTVIYEGSVSNITVTAGATTNAGTVTMRSRPSIYGTGMDDMLRVIKQTIDGGYIIAAVTFTSFDTNPDIWVVKLNSDMTISWQKKYGSVSVSPDGVYSIQQTTDGGYIVAGYTGDTIDNSSDIWILKLNTDGTVAWQKAYGGTNSDNAYSIQQTTDGGYIVAGYTISLGPWINDTDLWVLKLNSDGTVAWQRAYGQSGNEYGYSIQQTTDGGYIVAGSTSSFGAGSDDVWILKLNSNGTVAWQKAYGGIDIDIAKTIQQTDDGGYIVAGKYSSPAGNSDFWILKLISNGTVAWQKAYGGTNSENANSIQQTSDSGYIVTGITSISHNVSEDFWVLKLASNGSVEWQKAYGGTGTQNDRGMSILQTPDGGYMVAGHTKSPSSSFDMIIMKLDADGSASCTGTDTSVMPKNTSATVTNSTASMIITTATITDTTVVDQDTSVTQNTQCPQ